MEISRIELICPYCAKEIKLTTSPPDEPSFHNFPIQDRIDYLQKKVDYAFCYTTRWPQAVYKTTDRSFKLPTEFIDSLIAPCLRTIALHTKPVCFDDLTTEQIDARIRVATTVLRDKLDKVVKKNGYILIQDPPRVIFDKTGITQRFYITTSVLVG